MSQITPLMKRLLVVIFFLLIYSCNNSKKTTSTLSDFITSKSDVVIKIDQIESFKSDWNTNILISKLASANAHKHIANQLENLKLLKTNSSVLIGFETHKDSLHYTLATRLTDSLFVSEAIDSTALHYKVMDSIFIVSNSKNYLNSLKPVANPSLEKLLNTSKHNSAIALVLDEDSSNKFAMSIFKDDISNFANKMVLDTDISEDQIRINGISVSNDTLPKLTSIFNNSIPQENTLQHIVPNDADGYLGFTFNDFQTIKNNILNYKNIVTDSLFNPELFQTINEAGEIYHSVGSILVLKSIDASATQEALRDHQNNASSFRGISVFDYSDSGFFKSAFHPILSVNSISKYCVLDDFFVFASSEEALEYIITNYKNGNTFSNNEAYKNAMLHLSDESSLVSVSNSKKIGNQLSKLFKIDQNSMEIEDYKVSIFQLIKDDSFTHINGIIQKHKTRHLPGIISEEFNTTLDADIIMDPYFVTNHRTKGKDIVVQDVNNTLYLISNGGKILWKKQLNGTILGKIQQVDLYKNGRLQLAFATPKRVYILDRNGNDVSPFPLRFNDNITQPLSVFDYDNTRRYRFLVTQDSNILLYDKNGNIVNGFNYKNSGTIKTQPKHFRIHHKDYIVFIADNTMQILDRRGKIRIQTSKPYSFSGQPIFAYKNHFTTTGSQGELIQVDLKGELTTQNIGLEQLHTIDATSKSLVTLTENKLDIKRNSIELDFGDYTAPKIFYINDKIYVSLTDIQAQKIYLFDSQAKAISNFPVYGNSIIDFSNMDADRNLEFVSKAESNSIVVYEKN